MIGTEFETGKSYKAQSGFIVKCIKANKKSIVLDCNYWGNPRHTLKEDDNGVFVTIRHNDHEERVYASQEVA